MNRSDSTLPPTHRALPGIHPSVGGYLLRTCVPDADRVFLVGDFCGWDTGIEMRPCDSEQMWQVECPDAAVGSLYKLRVIAQDGSCRYEPDLFALCREGEGGQASRVVLPEPEGMDTPRPLDPDAPFNAYVLDAEALAAARQKDGLAPDALMRELSPYIKQMGYTHAALFPFGDEPPGGALAPDPRIGTLDELCAAARTLQSSGIGVAIGWRAKSYGLMGEALEQLLLAGARLRICTLGADALLVCPSLEDLACADYRQALDGITHRLRKDHPDVVLLSEADGTLMPFAPNPHEARTHEQWQACYERYLKSGKKRLTRMGQELGPLSSPRLPLGALARAQGESALTQRRFAKLNHEYLGYRAAVRESLSHPIPNLRHTQTEEE